MTDKARKVPGQSILERLYERGALRPSIGVSADFYERLGLDDPWAVDAAWSGEGGDPEGMFFFLSAAPYYRRLKARRQRAWRARRRLMMRLSEGSHGAMAAQLARAAGAGRQPGAWLELTPRAPMGMWSLDSALETVPVALQPDTDDEAARRPRWHRRERPMARAMRQSRRPLGPVEQVLDEIVQVSTGARRRVLRRVIEEVAELPAEQQIVVARRVRRQLRGPAARVAEVSLDDALEEQATRPLAVAAGRGERGDRRRKGLRPVLFSSPSLQVLTHEEPAPSEVAPQRVRRPARQAPQRVPTPMAHDEAPAARVVREARTQRVPQRAGPPVEAAPSTAAAPARPRRRPTGRVASLARSTERPAPSRDTAYGLRALEAPVAPEPTTQGTARVAARAVEAPSLDSRGRVQITPRVTSYVRPSRPEIASARRESVEGRARVAGRFRRSRLVTAPPTAYVEPWAESADEEGVERPLRQASPSRRALDRGQSTARPRREPAGHLEPVSVPEPVPGPRRQPVARPTVAEATRAEPSGLERIAERAEPSERLEPSARRTAVRPRRLSSTQRAIARSEPSRPTRRRVTLSAAPLGHLDQVVEPVPAASDEAPEPRSRFGRPTVRAQARATAVPRTDDRGRALLTTGATDYLDVATDADTEGPLSRSPVARPARARRMRGALVDTSVVVQPVAELEPESGAAERWAVPAERGARVEPTRAERPTSTQRIAGRLEATRREQVLAPARAPGADKATAREEILVREARGRVRSTARVATGEAAYAAARLPGQAAQPAEAARTPLERARASSRRVVRPAMPHTVASSDFRWLVPETDEPELRIEAERRTTPAGPVRRDRFEETLARVSSAVRAVQRADDARVVGPAARRALTGARVTAESVSLRRAPTAGGQGILLRVILEDEEEQAAGAPVARAERRGEIETVPVPGRPRAAGAASLRRAYAGAPGLLDRPLDHVAERGLERPPRRTAARTLRTADGRYTPGRRRGAPEPEQAPAFGRGAPGLPRHRWLPRVDVSGVVLPERFEDEAPEEPFGPGARGAGPRPRPLDRTLGYLATEERGRQRRSRRGFVPTDALARARAEEADEAPAWAHRAVTGSGIRGPLRPELEEARPRTGPGGELISALARARRPEDVVSMIMERGQGLRTAAGILPEPAVRLVERIVRIQEETREARARTAPEGDLLEGRRQRRAQGTMSSGPLANLPRPKGAVGAGKAAKRVLGLADKLMKLIRVAEEERRLADAQRMVRMAPDTQDARADAGHGEAAKGKKAKPVDMKQLESDVLAAVLRELDLMKLRRQEDVNDVWW